MPDILEFLLAHGYMVLFIWVFLDQAGLPLPAIPLLLAAGALIGLGQLAAPAVIVVILAASVPIDLFWFIFGRYQGGKVLNLLCAISLEPDY